MSDFQETQDKLKKELELIEKFKSKHSRVIETPFKDEFHVRELVDTATVRLGTLGVDWFVCTPRNLSTGEILIFNRTKAADESERIRQYVYIGVAEHVSESDFNEFAYDVDVMKLENMDIVL